MKKDLFSIFLTVFLLAFGISFVAPLLPLLLKSMGASTVTIGQIQTTYFLSFTITTTVLGRWIDRIGSKKLILTGLFISGLSIFLMPFMPDPYFFYLLRIFQGVGSSFLFAPTETAINILSPPEKRGSNMGLYGVVFAMGFAVGPTVGSTLYSIDPTFPFIYGSLSFLIAMAVLAKGFNEVRIPIKKKDWKFFDIIGLIKIPLSAATCYAFVEISIASFLSLFLDEIGIRGTALGLVFTFFAVGGAVSPFPAGKIADTAGKLPVLKFCGCLLFAATFTLNFVQNYWAICFLTFLVGIVAGALYPVALSLIGDYVPPEKMGTANASFSFFYGMGCVAGPLVTGWVLKLFSIKSLFYPMTFSAFVFVIIMTIDRSKGNLKTG